MDIITFARAHGIIINRLIDDGRWHRVPTTEHPERKDGAYLTRGHFGYIQDHSNHPEPIKWEPDDDEIAKVDPALMQRRAQEAADEIRRGQERAAKKAGWILHQAKVEPHPYLAAKGFPDERGPVWLEEGSTARKLCIPMRADGRLVGLQLISDQPAHEREGRDGKIEKVPAFEKKFLYGQRTSEAVYVFDNKGPKFFAEGWATSMSVRAALMALKVRYTIICCFNAGNMLKVARNHGEGIVIADNDNPSTMHPHPGGHGLAVAKESGLPYWLSDRCPEDFNDYHVRAGLFRASQSLKAVIMKAQQS